MHQSNGDAWLSRERVLALLLMLATLVAFYLCYLLVRPFLPAVTWALAVAIAAYPIQRWLKLRIRNDGIAAGLTTVIIGVILMVPGYFLARQLMTELSAGVDMIQQELQGQTIRSAIEANPHLSPVLHWLESHMNLSQVADQLTSWASGLVSTFLSSTIALLVDLSIVIFALFFFLRDRTLMLRGIRQVMPMSTEETDQVFDRVGDTIYATLLGSIVIGLVQGGLGGLMFWILGLPAPVLWGSIMVLMAMIPVLGPSIIWVPAVIVLMVQGAWTQAIILAAWGATAITFIDNLLYPVLVGGRMKLHTLPVFFSIIGGVIAFGPSGIIIGPVILSITDALLHIWKQRTAHGRSAEEGIAN